MLEKKPLREWLLASAFRVLENDISVQESFSGNLTEQQLENCAYDARFMFRTSLRRMADLWLGFRELA